MKRESLIASDSKQISVCYWDEVDNPKVVVQIIHGMSEHILRYDDFAKFLNSKGCIVVGDDHRAHGFTDKDNLGKAGEGDIFSKTVEDERQLTSLLKSKYSLPVVIMGHSYGSLLTQKYISLGVDEIAGCILSGSAFMKGLTVNFGYKIAKGKCKKRKDEIAEMFVKMTFKKYDKKFKEGQSAWLTRDIVEQGKYNVDSLCGFDCSYGFYRYLFEGLKNISASKHEGVDRNLKLLITSGDMDMFGGCGKLVNNLYEHYIELGFNPQIKLYQNCRHEIVNEVNRVEIYGDLCKFILSTIA